MSSEQLFNADTGHKRKRETNNAISSQNQPETPPSRRREISKERLKLVYEEIEKEREREDVLYAMFCSSNQALRTQYLDSLVSVMMKTYNKEALICDTNPHGIDCLDEYAEQVFRKAIDPAKKFYYAQLALLFMAFNFLPSFREYFVPSQKNVPPPTSTSDGVAAPPPPPPLPPVADREKLGLFIRTHVRSKCEDLLNGNILDGESLASGLDPIVVFVETLVPLYMKTCGVFIPTGKKKK